MRFEIMSPGHALWNRVRDYAANCSWGAGKALAEMMDTGKFTDWERVLTAVNGDQIRGFCTLTKTDCIPDVPYTPYIGFLFVDGAYRGNRLSLRLIEAGMAYLKTQGFSEVYLTSDHENLYEKYGFQVIDRKMAYWGGMEKIYRKSL